MGRLDSMEQRPKLAIKIAQCIAEWAEVEPILTLYVSTLLEAEPKAALAIYSSLENRAAQLRAVGAAATEKLHPDDADLDEAVMLTTVRRHERARQAGSLVLGNLR
jgi:hypothetical protein